MKTIDCLQNNTMPEQVITKAPYIYQGQQINLAYIRLRHFEFTNGGIISDFHGVGKVKYHFLTIKSVLFLVYQTISLHSKPLEIIKTQVFHLLIYSYMKWINIEIYKYWIFWLIPVLIIHHNQYGVATTCITLSPQLTVQYHSLFWWPVIHHRAGKFHHSYHQQWRYTPIYLPSTFGRHHSCW